MSSEFIYKWENCYLGDLVNIVIGGTPSRTNPSYWDVEKKTRNIWVSIRDLNQKIVTNSSEYLTDEGVRNSNVKLVPKNTVMMSFKLTLGRIARAGTDLYTNEAIASFLPKDTQTIDHNFLFYGLQSWNLFNEADQAIKGTTLNKDKLSRIECVIPPVKEQKRIAEILTSVDEVIESTQSQINKLENLKKATMNELLTKGIGHTEFKETEIGKIPKSWFVKSLGDLVTRFYQGINTVADELKYQQYGYPIIQTKHMTNGYLDIHDARYVSQYDYEIYASKFNPVVGDILLSNIGTVGKTYLIESEQKFLIAWNIFLIGCKETIVPKFLCIFLERLENQSFYDKLMTGNATKFVNKTTLSEIKLPIPSITEQSRIASQIRSVENSINSLKERLNAVTRLKNALMQDLLTGKVRVTVN